MYDDLKRRLSGCFYTIFTPFDEPEDVDYDALGNYISFLYKGGARRFYAMAYNSRYSQMNNEEILELNEFCIRKVKDLDRDSIVVVGDPIHGSTKQSAMFAEHARDCGADLISLIMREKYFSDEQVLDHYDQIGRQANFPILVHEMPFLYGYDGKQMHWPVTLFPKLKQVSHIAALKEDAKDFDTTCVALALEPDIKVIIAGPKAQFVKYRDYGADAYLNGISIINAEFGELFWKAYKEDDDVTIRFVTERLEAPFFERCVAKYGWHRCNKAFLQAAGLMHRRDRMPMPQLDDEQFKDIEACYADVMAAWREYQSESLAV